ncbi:hypothetical protein ACP4OV_026139 [Aristida adscensionis]
MGLLRLKRLMSIQRERKRRQQIQGRNGSITSVPHKKDSLSQEDDHSQGDGRLTCFGPILSEDIWCHIHSLMPLRDSARSAVVSRAFLHHWRCHPKLTFTEEAVGLKENACQHNDIAKGFISRVDHILKNHSGFGVKRLELIIPDDGNVDAGHLNGWLQSAITPGIEEVILVLPTKYGAKFNFPCSIFLDGRGNSIQFIYIHDCAFRSPVGFDYLRSLTKLYLSHVRITGDELMNLFSKSFNLEELDISDCHEIIRLKIPLCLEPLSCLIVAGCDMLQVIESAAPNLSTFDFFREPIELSLGEYSPVKNLIVNFPYGPNSVSYAITKLPPIVPYLETLTIFSNYETVNTPMVANKFLHLQCLKIYLTDDKDVVPAYDYLSLVSFLNASPVLETFILSVDPDDVERDSIFEAISPMRQIPEYKHARLKNVQISGFCSAKSTIELACHIVENATSLESLTLDSIFDEVWGAGTVRCEGRKFGKCRPISRHMILEAYKAIRVIKKYILGRVPSTVKLNVLEPCSRCHVVDVKLL